MISRDIITLLDEEVARNNTREFIVDDPVQFPRRYDDVRDIEIVSLLVAAISWGRRPMILRDADRMLALMDHQPYRYMMEEGYEDLPSRHNIHRTFFASDLQWYLRGLREIYRRYGTLDDFALAHGVGEDPMPAWRLVEEMQRVVSGVNGGTNSPQCLPTNLRTTALKRVNMAQHLQETTLYPIGCACGQYRPQLGTHRAQGQRPQECRTSDRGDERITSRRSGSL